MLWANAVINVKHLFNIDAENDVEVRV